MRGGQASRLTRHIADRALALAVAWPEPLQLSLNITAMDLAEEDFAANILAAVEAAGFRPGPSQAGNHRAGTCRPTSKSVPSGLPSWRMPGCSIALDDFGAGFCNFRYLKRLPLDAIKLDRSMIEGIADDERDLAVLRGIVALAKALDLTVTAEGIETEAQRETVCREGCCEWQGFLGAEPMAADAFEAFARSAG